MVIINWNLKNSMLNIRNLRFSRKQLQYCLGLALSIISVSANAQTFTVKGGGLYDYMGYYFRQEFDIVVSGLPKVSGSKFGLEAVILNIHHDRVSDLKITLQSPAGTSIWLTNRNGSDNGQNYINTRF